MASFNLKALLELLKKLIEAIDPYLPADVVQSGPSTDLKAVVCGAMSCEELNGETADALLVLEAELAGKIDPTKWQSILAFLAKVLPAILPLFTS